MTKSSPSHHSATTETTFSFSCKLGAMQVLQAAWPEVRSRELSPNLTRAHASSAAMYVPPLRRCPPPILVAPPVS